jgi:hypothetical protein
MRAVQFLRKNKGTFLTNYTKGILFNNWEGVNKEMPSQARPDSSGTLHNVIVRRIVDNLKDQ